MTRYFFAGGDSKPAIKCMLACDVKNILFSFFYIQKKRQKNFDALVSQLTELKEKGGYTFILDSGGFTYKDVAGRGFQTVRSEAGAVRTKKLDPYAYLEEYTKFLIQYGHLFDVCAEFEPDEVFGGVDIVDENREKMLATFEKHGVEVNLMPVFDSFIRDLDTWEEWCEDSRYKHLGFVGNDIRLASRLVNKAHRHGKKVHGFAQTKIEDLQRAKFDTVDSTGWISGQKYGEVFIFQRGKWTRLNATQKNKRKLYKNYFKAIGIDWDLINRDDPNELLKASCLSWKRLFDHFEARSILETASTTSLKRAAPTKPVRGVLMQLAELGVDKKPRERNVPKKTIKVGGKIRLMSTKATAFDAQKIIARALELSELPVEEAWEKAFGRDEQEITVDEQEMNALFKPKRARGFSPEWYALLDQQRQVEEALEKVSADNEKRNNNWDKFLVTEPLMSENEVISQGSILGDTTDYTNIKQIQGNTAEMADGSHVAKDNVVNSNRETLDSQNDPTKLTSSTIRKKLSVHACHTCAVSTDCSYYQPGYLCYYKPAFQTLQSRNVKDVMQALEYITDKNLERTMRAFLMEEIQMGGQVDPQASNVSQLAFGQLEKLASLKHATRPESFKVTLEGQGESASILTQLLSGAKQPEEPKQLEAQETNMIDVTPKKKERIEERAIRESKQQGNRQDEYDITELATIQKMFVPDQQ